MSLHRSSPLAGLALACGLGLVGIASAGALQRGDLPPGQAGADPLGAAAAPVRTEQERLEEGLLGCWNLMLYEAPDQRIDPRQVSGFLTFQDGYSTIWWRSNRVVPGLIVGSEVQELVQSEVRHYRVSEFLTLQTAPVHRVDTLTGQLRVGGAMEPTEYTVELEEDLELVLTKLDGTRMTFRKIASERFPRWATDRLDETRGGLVPMPPNPRNRRR